MSRSSGQQNRSLFIRFIPGDTRPEDLKNLFNKYGRVKDVYIPRDYYTHKLRGFAYVEFEKTRDAENTMRNASRIRLFGKELDVEYAQGDRKTPNEMRTRYSSKSSNHRSGWFSGRFNESPIHIGQRERSRSRSGHRRYISRSRSRSPSIRRHHRSYTPEIKIKKSQSCDGDAIDRQRFQKNGLDMIDGIIELD